jgi:ABC-type sugar transport system, periplasmic component
MRTLSHKVLSICFAASLALFASAEDTKIQQVAAPGKVKLTMWVALPSQYADVLKSYNDTVSMKELEKKTGVKVDVRHPTVGQESQAFNLMLASGDMPDLVQERAGAIYYPGGGDQAIADGVYLELTDLINKYAPNYKRWMQSNDLVKKLTITDTGKRWGMFTITPTAEPAWTGYVVRKDWLDELGLGLPVTLDDWYTVLKAFKKKGVESPLLVYNTGVPAYGQIVSAFGICADGSPNNPTGGFYQAGGKVAYGPVQAAYKDYLTLMNKWFKEGLLDPDFMGRTDAGFYATVPAYLAATGKAGMFPQVWGRSANAFVVMGNVKDNPKFFLAPVASPKKTKDQKIHFNYPSYQVTQAIAITKNCKDPVAAIKWIDQLYTTEGSNIVNYGVEGDTFVMKNGDQTYTDKILHPEGGITPQQAIAKNFLWAGPGIYDFKRLWKVAQASGQGEMLKAYQVWAQDDIDNVIPPVTPTQAEATELSKLMPDITTYVNEMTVKFIIGEEPLSKFDAFVAQINKMNIDRAVQLKQTSLDRFNARK